MSAKIVITSLPFTINCKVLHGTMPYANDMVGFTQCGIQLMDVEVEVAPLPSETMAEAALRTVEALAQQIVNLNMRLVDYQADAVKEQETAFYAKQKADELRRQQDEI